MSVLVMVSHIFEVERPRPVGPVRHPLHPFTQLGSEQLVRCNGRLLSTWFNQEDGVWGDFYCDQIGDMKGYC